MESTFTDALQALIRISVAEIEAFSQRCNRKFFPKKELLSNDEQAADEVFFIESGLIRVKIVDVEGREHTTHFATAGQFIADYSAFLTHQQSRYQLQALEDTTVVVIPRTAIEWGYEYLTEGEKLGRLIAEYYFIYLDTRIQYQYTLSPIERYRLMDGIFPDLHNRVPQHMIASYLGITPVHLSRIKHQLR